MDIDMDEEFYKIELDLEDEFIKKDTGLYFKYIPYNGIFWIKDKIKNREHFDIKRIFFVSEKDICEINEKRRFIIIKIGTLEKDYYKIDKKILNIKFDLYFQKDIELDIKLFKYSGFRKSIFKALSEVLSDKKELYIGGEYADIELKNFKRIIKQFPKKYEEDLYIDSRIHQVLENEISGLKDCTRKFEDYRERNKYTIKRDDFFDEIYKYEIEKYEEILKHLKLMLENQEKYTESQWQKEILKIIFLIFPKYVLFFREVKINIISDTSRKSKEKVDFMLINNCGGIDIIEIKKPYNNKIISKSTDRDNYYPSTILTKTVMQVEKYIYHLNRWGQNAEKYLNKKYKSEIPEGMSIKNINPKGLIIMGDARNYTQKEINDLEIIKKMYSNIIDVITYDDLINRLENIVKGMKKS